ncbi:MAG: VapC toxin family PIN domain ribonuclease [Pseudomonadota bacterium]|nr:VapC toxin family PIN domain ribonuclease [Pseudomonadota bacterium]
MLVSLLNRDQVRVHPMVIAELACGTPPFPRTQTLGDLALLPPVQVASLSETVGFIEREALYGLGCGLVDMMLLASTRMTPGTVLWTLDKRLADLADRFNVAMPDP